MTSQNSSPPVTPDFKEVPDPPIPEKASEMDALLLGRAPVSVVLTFAFSNQYAPGK